MFQHARQHKKRAKLRVLEIPFIGICKEHADAPLIEDFRSSGFSATIIGIRLRLRLSGSLWFRRHYSSVIRSGTNYRRESRRLPRLMLRRFARPRDLPVVRRLLMGLILESNQVMLNAPSLSPRENELVQREIQEIRDALEAFKAAVEAGEVTGFKDGGMRSNNGW
jgi:hypothetical protein